MWVLKIRDGTSDGPTEILKDVLWNDDDDIFAESVGIGDGLSKTKIKKKKTNTIVRLVRREIKKQTKTVKLSDADGGEEDDHISLDG